MRAKTPSTKSYPGTSHLQSIPVVQTIFLESSLHENNECGKPRLRWAIQRQRRQAPTLCQSLRPALRQRTLVGTGTTARKSF